MSISFLIGVLTAQASVHANTVVPATQAYVDCVVNNSVELIPSGEPADTIVKAAQPACESLLPAVLDEHATKVAADPVIARQGARFNYNSYAEAQAMAPRYRQLAADFALQRVVAVKAQAGKQKK